jgi:hypothetical protein
VLYTLPIGKLTLNVGGLDVDVSSVLASGRANYILFQRLVAWCTGMSEFSEGGDSDLRSPSGLRAEVKAFHDEVRYPGRAARWEMLHTASSATFGPNNAGPRVKALLKAGDYAGALALCRALGYDKNDVYVYTNTRGFAAGMDLRYLVLPTSAVLSSLSLADPRLVSRSALLAQVTRCELVPADGVLAAATA